MRILAAMLACFALAGLSGCGGANHKRVAPQPSRSAVGGTVRVSADHVALVFRRLTGERLTISRNHYFDALNLPESALTRAYGRYGQFSIYVMKQGSVAVALTQHRTGPTPRATADGIYWKQDSSSPVTWEAAKAVWQCRAAVDGRPPADHRRAMGAAGADSPGDDNPGWQSGSHASAPGGRLRAPGNRSGLNQGGHLPPARSDVAGGRRARTVGAGGSDRKRSHPSDGLEHPHHRRPDDALARRVRRRALQRVESLGPADRTSRHPAGGRRAAL